MVAFNAPKPSVVDVELPPPESDAQLAELSVPQNELVMTLRGSPDLYGIVRKTRATTTQSDYFRMQFKLFAYVNGDEWVKIEGDEANYRNNTDIAWVAVDHPSRTVQFGPRLGITCNPRLQLYNLDTYLFAQIITWAKTHYPNYAVAPGGVALSGKATMEERLQRTAFYASQGFDFDWLDEEQRTGRYSKERVAKLLGAWDGKLIGEVNGDQLLDTLARQAKNQADLETRLSSLQNSYTNLRDQLKKERTVNQVLTGLAVCVLLVGLMFLVGIF